jgi:DNA-directed RNA polymerase subunit RPC12/RpoP
MSEPSYAAAWTRYRRIRLVTILLIVSFPLGLPLVIALFASVIGATGASVLVPVWIVAIVVAAMEWAHFPCPRCGEKFRRKAGMAANKCRSCGLPMFAENEAEAGPNPYREPPEPTPAQETYITAWKKYRRLRRMRSPWLLGGAVVVAGIVAPQFGSASAGLVAVIWSVFWFLVFATGRWRLLSFRCPRCKRRFHSWTNDTKYEWCVHCRLRRFALDDADA